MQTPRLATALIQGLAVPALIAGCSRKEPEQAADATPVDAGAPAASDPAAAAYPTRVFFGDTHLHTANVNGRRGLM